MLLQVVGMFASTFILVTQSDFAFPGEKNVAAKTEQTQKSDYQAF